MKKTLIASAIAAISFSGTALAMENASELAARMDSMPSVYGNIQLAITHTNGDNAGSEVDLFDNGSTIGFKHEHMLAPGITGFFKAELEFNADNKAGNSGLDSFDEAYIGVKGDSFGQVWVGSDDSTYERAIDEIYNYWEVGTGISGNYDTGEGDLVQYSTPSFGGLTLGAAVQVNGDAKTGGKSYPYQVAAVYAVDALELAFAVDSNDGNLGYSEDTLLSVNNENTYGVRASYNLDNLRLTGSYETRKDVADVFGVMGAYTMGKNQFALSYQLQDKDNAAGDKNDTIAIQALRNLSDNMYVYFEGYISNADVANEYTVDGLPTDERTIAAVGATYYF
jgi:predicted porin